MLRGRVWIASILALSSPALAQEEGPALVFGGDVLYDAPLAYQLRHRALEVGRVQAYREVFADLAPALSAADLAVVNLEVPISPRYREREGGPPVFHAPAHFLDALGAAGVDALTVANNHAYDQGRRGLRHTLRAAARRELVTIGAGRDAASSSRATLFEREGARIAVAAWSEGSNHRPRAAEGTRPCIAFVRDGTIEASLRAARAEADLVVASFHWTSEALAEPTASMRATARRAAEAGADLVIGHGTHVPGRTELIVTADGRRVHALYSLGNLLAAMEDPAGTLGSEHAGVRDAPLATIRTVWRGERLAIASVEVSHHWIARPASAPWLEGGRIPISRTVAIDAALARIEEAGCGEACVERANAYRQRAELARRAMRPIEPGERVATPPARARRSAPARIPDDDPRLAPYLRGVRIAASFHDESALEVRIAERALARIAALMREDRSLRCEVTVRAASEALARRRARRVKGLIAIRGPSRSRFVTSGHGGSAGRVRVRLFR